MFRTLIFQVSPNLSDLQEFELEMDFCKEEKEIWESETCEEEKNEKTVAKRMTSSRSPSPSHRRRTNSPSSHVSSSCTTKSKPCKHPSVVCKPSGITSQMPSLRSKIALLSSPLKSTIVQCCNNVAVVVETRGECQVSETTVVETTTTTTPPPPSSSLDSIPSEESSSSSSSTSLKTTTDASDEKQDELKQLSNCKSENSVVVVIESAGSDKSGSDVIISPTTKNSHDSCVKMSSSS